MSEKTPTTALATRSFTLMPASLGEAREIATMIANSDFAPKDYKGKPENVIIAMQMGADLGLKPMQALQNISVINGRPSIWGDAALALAMPALDSFKEFVEGDGDKRVAVCVLKRKGWPDETRRTFSVEDAKKAGLWTKPGPWQTYPQRMMAMRARSWALRDSCADLLMGLSLAEEAMDFPNAIDTTASVSVEEVQAEADPMEQIPEGLRENIGKGFTALAMGPGPVKAKIAEFMGAAEGTEDEKAQKLVDWLRDEYALRKTGKRRVAANAKEGKAEPKTEPAKPAQADPVVEQTPPVVEAEVITGDDIFGGKEVTF